MAAPTVAVVVTTYHRNERLARALDSVEAQTHEPVEVLVVDGSGTAHARPVVERYPGVDYWAQERDEGPHAARSAGARRVDAEVVQFLDDDDRLHPNKIERQLPLLDEDTGVVYCGIEDEDYGQVRPDPEVRGDVLDRALALNTFPCIPSTMLIDAGLVDELQPFQHRHGADDTGMKIELARRTAFDYVGEPLVVRGCPKDPLARSWAHIEGRKHLLRTYGPLYERIDPNVRRSALSQTLLREGVKRLEEAAWSGRAILAFARALRHAPGGRTRAARHLVASLAGRPGLRWARG